MVNNLIRSSGGTPGIDLFKKIETLHNRNIAQWISSYMHVLRIFGNESAHERNTHRMPSELTENDFIISLFCLNRVLQFWLDTKTTVFLFSIDLQKRALHLKEKITSLLVLNQLENLSAGYKIRMFFIFTNLPSLVRCIMS